MIIRHFERGDAQHFRALNLKWIEEAFSVEETDRHQLDDPQGNIIERGGFIAIGELDGRVVATGAIIRPHLPPPDGRAWLEIIKMATDPVAQGYGFGSAILDFLIEQARDQDAAAIWLETNDGLGAATRLYKRKGFKQLKQGELWPTPYERCNLQFALELHSSR